MIVDELVCVFWYEFVIAVYEQLDDGYKLTTVEEWCGLFDVDLLQG